VYAAVGRDAAEDSGESVAEPLLILHGQGSNYSLQQEPVARLVVYTVAGAQAANQE
jgi:hypothetical protein